MLKKNSKDKVSFWKWLATFIDHRRKMSIRVLKVRILAISVAVVVMGLICVEVQLFAVGAAELETEQNALQEMPVIRRIGFSLPSPTSSSAFVSGTSGSVSSRPMTQRESSAHGT